MAEEECGGEDSAVLLHHRLHANHRHHLPHLPSHAPRQGHQVTLHEVHLPQVRRRLWEGDTEEWGMGKRERGKN